MEVIPRRREISFSLTGEMMEASTMWESWKVRRMVLCTPLRETVVMQLTGEVIVSEAHRSMGMVFRHIKKSRRKIVRAKEQCYNRKSGQGKCPACYKFETYNRQIENIESLGSGIFETGRDF